MKTPVISIVAAAIGLAGSVSVGAQMTGSRLPGGSQSSMVGFVGYYDDEPASARPSDQAVATGMAMAACMVRRNSRSVERYLNTADAGRHAAMEPLQSMMPTCLNEADRGATQLRLSASAFDGALAKAALVREAPMSLPAIEPGKTDVPVWLSRDANQRVVQEMAICLADRFPAQSLAFVISSRDSATDADALGALSPHLGECLIRGTTLHANKEGIRLALASAIYHRIHDPAPASAPAEKK